MMQSLGRTGSTWRKASRVYFTVTALMTSSGSNVDEAQLVRVGVVDGGLVLKTQYVGEEGAHLAGSEDQYSHFFID